jgi:uncharacterized membrane-anchored protein YhcB (DUF1043 family)
MESTFIRDKHSKALINTDVTTINARRLEKRQVQKMSELQNEINEVKNDLLEIKQLLQSIITRG